MSNATETQWKIMMATVVRQALHELLSKSERLKNKAIKFLLSEDCKLYCDVIKFDYSIIERINFDNPLKSELRDVDYPIFTVGSQSKINEI